MRLKIVNEQGELVSSMHELGKIKKWHELGIPPPPPPLAMHNCKCVSKPILGVEYNMMIFDEAAKILKGTWDKFRFGYAPLKERPNMEKPDE